MPDQTEGVNSFLRAARAGNLSKVLEYLRGSIDINTSNMVSTIARRSRRDSQSCANTCVASCEIGRVATNLLRKAARPA